MLKYTITLLSCAAAPQHMYKLVSYLKFIFKSTNHHGVHSPFVYNLISKGFYNKSLNKKNELTLPLLRNKKRSKKKERLLNTIINYFEKDGECLIVANYISSNIECKFDLIFNDLFDQLDFEKILNYVHNDTVIVVDNIYESTASYIQWENLKNHPLVTVSIDTFTLGFLFFRTEQAKQHFIIRA